MLNPAINSDDTQGNRMLDALPAPELEQIVPHLRRVFVQRDQVMQSPGEPIEWLHFPIDAFAWAWTDSTGADRPASVLTVGQRGVIEWNHVLESDRGQSSVTVISPGSAWRLPVDVFDRLPLESALRKMLLRYANSCILNSAVRLACNSEHNVDQRLARWLLWVADESNADEFYITHQQIAEIAAIRRPSVSLALSQFQRQGFIRSQHGKLRLLDRKALEQRVCPCYWTLKRNCEDVFEQ
ncbi:MAG TPA: Crp/Fnr family transcriptional regulator [Candidatus Baltobacteraceae bacterium]|nr:Crp/Fnr family transcriptional regulator [Candidatus Baltobacteraceae bacterium]